MSTPINSVHEPATVYGWGHAITLYRNPQYAIRQLDFEFNRISAFQYHMHSSRTIYALTGQFFINLVDTTNGRRYAKTLTAHHHLHIPYGQPYQIDCTSTGSLLEIVSPPVDDDACILHLGDSQPQPRGGEPSTPPFPSLH